MIKSVYLSHNDTEILLPLIKHPHEPTSNTYYSILVGPNGTSKSRILGSIASELCAKSFKKKKPGPRKRFDPFVCKFDNSFSFTRLIAIASSPYDKFPAGSINLDREINTEEDNYFYLGIRSKNGLGLRKNKDRIFDLLVAFLNNTNENSKVDAIDYIFKKLNFNTKATLIWEFGDGRSYFEKKETGFRNLVSRFSGGAQKGENILRFDLNGNRNDRIGLLHAILAEREGQIKIKSLLISKKDENGHYDLLESSSGELTLFVHCLGLAACLKNESIVLIDEPEISLHPNWQIDYFEILQMFGNFYEGCHFIVATHSPHILASLPSTNSNVLAMNRTKSGGLIANQIEHSTGGWSVEQILLDVFGIQTMRNKFFENRVRSLLQLIADPDSPQRKKNINRIVEELDIYQLQSDDPLKRLLSDARSILSHD